MKHYFLSSIFVLVFSFTLNAQTFTKLNYDNHQCEFLEIKKVELNEKYTIIHFSLTPPKEYKHGIWFCIEKHIKLINDETKKEYALKQLKGVKKCPKKFNTFGKKPIGFKIYFDRINDLSATYSLIEDAEGETTENPFNIYNISIQ